MKRLPLYPFFFGFFAALSLYASNATEAHLRELIVPLSATLVATLLILGLAKLIVKDIHRAAMLVAVVVFWFFTYGHWIKVVWKIIPWADPQHAFINQGVLSVLAGLILLFAVFFASRRIKPENWTLGLNRVGLALMLVPLIFVVFHREEVKIATPKLQSDTVRPLPPAILAHRPAGAPTPDIYFIVLDAHTRADVLRRLYGYNEAPFLQHLRDKGFYVAEASTSNYIFTELSVGSTLELRYLDELNGRFDFSLDPVNPILQQSSLVATLKSMGYSWVSFQTFQDNLCFPNADVYYKAPDMGGITPFQELMINTTALWELGGKLLRSQLVKMHDTYHVKRRVITSELANMSAAVKLPGPKFVFLHIMAPHIPFVFMPDGSDPGSRGYGALNDPGLSGDFSVGDYRHWYRDQTIFIDHQISDTIDNILANSPQPPIIVLEGDHGARSAIVWGNPDTSDLTECTGNLTAVLLPGKNSQGLYPSISPVNLFRVVLNDYFDAKLPLLPDKVYFSTTSPFIYADITSRVRPPTAITAAPLSH